MIADRIITFRQPQQRGTGSAAPARRQKFAALCHHWWQFAERPRKEPKAGVPSRLKGGERGE